MLMRMLLQKPSLVPPAGVSIGRQPFLYPKASHSSHTYAFLLQWPSKKTSGSDSLKQLLSMRNGSGGCFGTLG